MPLQLKDLVTTEAAQKHDAAIRLDDGLAKQAEGLVERFTPTQSALTILKHLQKTVLPDASYVGRAMIWHGIYGSGKSHLGVLAGHVLQDGAHTTAFSAFLKKLDNLGEAALRRELENTFLPTDDPNARPYLVITLYGSGKAPTLQLALLEGLYNVLKRHVLDVDSIMPKTEYDAALHRFEAIVQHQPALANARLEQWNLAKVYLTTAEMAAGLKNHAHEALDTFKQWHSHISVGLPFKPADGGGKGVTEAYKEACRNLHEYHNYAGIAILWDEFGYALEHLMSSAGRNVMEEIFELQNFIETVCKPAQGHVLFMGLTHRSLGEYGTAAKISQDIQQRLRTIEGRYAHFRVELKASESEGYHLLGSLTGLTPQGKHALQAAQANLEHLAAACGKLSVFAQFTNEADLHHIAHLCYPLHPLAAAGLFAIAARGNYSEASRTVFTFYRDLEKNTQGRAFFRPVDEQALFGTELIRLHELLIVYADPIEKEMPALMDMYRDAKAKVMAQNEAIEDRANLLSLLLLGRVLGEHFQPTKNLLSAALYDALPGTAEAARLQIHLSWLKEAGFIYKNDLTGVWELESGGSVEVEPLIQEEIQQIGAGQGTFGLLQQFADMRGDLLPHLGTHDLEPSPAGIVRSYEVSLLDTPFDPQKLRIKDERMCALVFLALPPDVETAEKERKKCEQIPVLVNNGLIYVWIPRQGVKELDDKLRRYVAIERLLQHSTTGESMRRRLLAEWESNRHALINLLRERFGRDGLHSGQAQIFRAGDAENTLPCRSWHEFREKLAEQVNALYPQEIPVRAMNVNRMYVEKERKIPRIEELLHNILRFEELPDKDRNDLLGETETSERAAIIDGTLGEFSNALFIQRAEGWAIKTIEENNDTAKAVLQVIREEMTRKREKPYKVSELRKKLLSPPYGLPPAAMPIFAVVALRGDFKRLRWVNQKGDFEDVLAQAFNNGADMDIRREDFGKKQLALLRALSMVLEKPWNINEDENEQAAQTIKELRNRIRNYPDAVKNSNKLSEPARQLVMLVSAVGKTAHDIVDFLLSLPGVRDGLREGLEISEYPEVQKILADLLGEFEKIANERFWAIRTVLFQQVPEEIEERKKLADGLRLHKQDRIADILLGTQSFDKLVEPLVQVVKGKTLDKCTDIEVGSICGDLKSIFENSKRQIPSVPVIASSPASTIVSPMPIKPGNELEEILSALRQVIQIYQGKVENRILLQAIEKLRDEINIK